MDKVELYREVFASFRTLCAEGKQPSSFNAYCKAHGVEQSLMLHILKDEFQNVKALSGFQFSRSAGDHAVGKICSQIYEEFKRLCAEGRQPGTFKAYCLQYGITRKQMHDYLYRNRLRVAGLPGFRGPAGAGTLSHICQEIPFEEVIFEDAGFLPAEGSNAITVRVDGHVAVIFPADTDVAVIAKFVRKMGKEAGHVGS